jgi:hypothetical protein
MARSGGAHGVSQVGRVPRRAWLHCAGRNGVDGACGESAAGLSGVQSTSGSDFMKLTSILMLTAGIIVTGAFMNSRGYAQLSKDDVKWINQCIADNKGQPGGTPDIVRKYCMCMNEEMDDNETRSVTQFEKANPKIRAKCDKQSGWK